MKYWLSNQQNKEIFLNEIKLSVHWRCRLQQLNTIGYDLHQIAISKLLKLENYVKNIPSDDILFSLIGNPSEIAQHTISYAIRCHGDEIDGEPEDWVHALRKSLLLISVQEDGRLN